MQRELGAAFRTQESSDGWGAYPADTRKPQKCCGVDLVDLHLLSH